MPDMQMRIPNAAHWPVTQLGDVCALISRGTAPVYVERSDVMAIGQRCVTVAGFDAGKARPHSHRAMRGVVEPACGDVLLNSTGTGTIGRSCVFRHKGQFVLDGHVTVLRPNQARLDGRWLNAVLRSAWGQSHLERFCYSGSTNQVELNRVPLAATCLPLPPIHEQRLAAEVLDTLDTTIRQTEAIIAKLKQVKQRLLHDLLTRGIADNGELRPPQSEAPRLYKESALGWIPIRWDVCGVLDIAPADRQCILTGPFGAQLGQADFIAEGVPVLRIGNVQAGYIDWTDTQFVSYAKAARLDRFSVLSGDLLFARQGATTGRNALADDRSNGALINYHLIRVAVDRGRCEPTFLHAAFNSHHSRGQVDQEKGRGTREGINSKQIAALRFVLPPIREQSAIVARVKALGDIMAQEALLAAKQRTLKSGLMDDLLTGRVRVTPLLEGASQ